LICQHQEKTPNLVEAATLKAMGMTCMSTIGGSSGPVFGTLLVTLAKELPAEPAPADLASALDAPIKALTRLGKAVLGELPGPTRARRW
jgi:hypothetical protein